MDGEEILDDSEDSLLLVAGQFADFFEDAACLADGAALALNGVLPAEQVIHGNIERAGDFGDVIGPEGGGAAFRVFSATMRSPGFRLFSGGVCSASARAHKEWPGAAPDR